MEGEQGSLNGRREVIRGELRRNVMGQLKDQIYLEDEQLYEQIDTAIRQKGKETYLPLKERLWLRNSLYDSFRRLDILQELLDDKDVTEIMINGAGKIFIEKKGNMVLWNRRFEKTEQLEDIIQQIVGKVNRIVNVSSPIADARLEDGSRVHIVLPPVALDGPVVTIRKFPDPITIEKLIRFQALTEEAAQFLEQLVKAKYNLFVCGGTNSGKTTFLNALSSFIPETERVITIEDSAELQITHVPNLVRLETRNANTEGEGEITISQLIKASLRMNPSRIIVGEVRGAEALDMLQAIICTICTKQLLTVLPPVFLMFLRLFFINYRLIYFLFFFLVSFQYQKTKKRTLSTTKGSRVRFSFSYLFYSSNATRSVELVQV